MFIPSHRLLLFNPLGEQDGKETAECEAPTPRDFLYLPVEGAGNPDVLVG